MMKRLTLISIFYATLALGATPELRLRPSVILPGTAADVVVVIHNDKATTLDLSPRLSLHVTPPSGSPFFADGRLFGDESRYRRFPAPFLVDEDSTSITIAPRTTVALSIPFDDNETFFQDPRFLVSGRYVLRAVLEANGAELWSEPASLDVEPPTGRDAEVWAAMTSLCGPQGCAWHRWQSTGFDRTILSDFPDSRYAQFATGADVHGRPDAAARRSIGMQGPYREYILLHEATLVKNVLLADAIVKGDHRASLAAAAEMKEALERLISESDNEFVVASAQKVLLSVPSPAAIGEILRKLNEADRARPDHKIRPYVECVQPGSNGEWIAWFGYDNPFPHDYRLSSWNGTNKFEPKPHERGQPENFKQGGELKAFSVAFDGAPITWYVKGEKAVASSETSPRCED